MAKETVKDKNWKRRGRGGTGSALYGLGFLGAVIYFFQHATSFWIGILGFFKALVWPAFIVYKLL
ncbi:MAG TPA: hypothetical protein VF810_03410, partial [Patescibacteria group bacterium]